MSKNKTGLTPAAVVAEVSDGFLRGLVFALKYPARAKQMHTALREREAYREVLDAARHVRRGMQ